MLKLIQVEFLKLRRRKFIWLMLLAALFMPLAAVFYFSSVKGTGVDPIMFYKWTAFSYTPWIILPVVLGMLCTMLMYNENQYDMLKQLWIVAPVSSAYWKNSSSPAIFATTILTITEATSQRSLNGGGQHNGCLVVVLFSSSSAGQMQSRSCPS